MGKRQPNRKMHSGTNTKSATELTAAGNIHLTHRRENEAEAAYRQAIDDDATYPPPYRNLALLYQFQGQYDDAIALYRRYLDLVPDDGEVHHNLALLYLQQEQDTEAAAEFEVASRLLSPDTPATATNLGVGYFYRGEMEVAVMLYEHALALDAAFTPARYHAGIAYLYLGRLDDSVAALEAVVDAEPDFPNAALNLGVAYNTAGRPTDAIHIFEALLDHDPTNPSAVLNLGYAALEAGQIERAQTCFGWCIDSCPPDSVYAQKAAHMLEASLAT